jgi:hypothetical protein
VRSSVQAGPSGPSSTFSRARTRVCSATLPAPEAFQETGALVFGQFDTVFLVGHGTWGGSVKGRLSTIYHAKITNSGLTVQ